MRVSLPRERSTQVAGEVAAATRVPRLVKPFATVGLALALVLGTVPMAAQADDENLTPGPTVVADPNSPTGYTGHFVY